jgi:hypothetical protein
MPSRCLESDCPQRMPKGLRPAAPVGAVAALPADDSSERRRNEVERLGQRASSSGRRSALLSSVAEGAIARARGRAESSIAPSFSKQTFGLPPETPAVCPGAVCQRPFLPVSGGKAGVGQRSGRPCQNSDQMFRNQREAPPNRSDDTLFAMRYGGLSI